MSERQARLNRKEKTEQAPKKRTDKATVIFRIIAVVVVAAVAGLGVYATWDKISAGIAEKAQTEQAQEPRTVADVAEEKGLSVEELAAKCGFEEGALTADMSESDLYGLFTIDSYAKFEDKDAQTLKTEYGIEDLADDTPWQEASMKVPMGKIAEMNGQTFEEMAEQGQLPADITAETTYEEAMTIMQAVQQAASEAEAPAEGEEAAAEGEEAPETEETAETEAE